MPTYVYKFIETGETIEVRQSFDDDPLTEAVHPERGVAMPVKKVFLPVGITFKGDGFYKTDSRRSSSGSSGRSAAGSGDTASTDSSGSGASGETASTGSSESGASSGSGSSESGSGSSSGSTGD